MGQVDFELVRRRVADAAGRTFEAVRSANPGESFYAFALTTLDDGLYVSPSMNSEEAYRRLAAENGATTPADLAAHRWNPFDWQYEQAQAEPFDLVNALLSTGDGTSEAYDEDDPLGFEKYKAGIMAAMVLGLQDAAATGVFGTGATRESLTLLCTIADSADAAWFAFDSAKRLNSEPAFETFARGWRAFLGEEEEEDGADHALRELYLARFAPAP